MANKKISLYFKGPLHFDQLKNLTDIDKPGIYIWGFMYGFNENGLTEAINFNDDLVPILKSEKMKFIPYYVGLAKNKTILTRIKDHNKVGFGNGAKYKRFKKSYYKEFFKGVANISENNFIPNTWGSDSKKCDKYFKNQPACKGCPYESIANPEVGLIYSNVENCLIKMYGNEFVQTRNILNKVEIPITDFLEIIPEKNDTLSEMVIKYNNFWFCYVPLDKDLVNECFEAFVFWSLKGKTISKTEEFESIKFLGKCYKIEPKIDIFKDEVSDYFPGY